ncbi:MAG: ATP-dependent RecD-like DNA helicase [Syntrophomonadaceae bacterium]|nr:ATP-dependent RecD-like DNA helicase [Syntrophomonadaceae bacterium]
MDTIYGYLERITYQHEETNFMVARIKEKGKKDLTTIIGNLTGINPGESLKLDGKWVTNKKYGPQFQVEKYETIIPATVHGIEKYLGSGLIKGIGPGMARRMVKKFQLDTLEVIEHAPERLLEVEGIGPKRVEMITRAWEDQKEIKEIMVFLQSHGVTATYAAKIYKQYGEESIQIVQANPYRLAADIRGIGFLTADRIARCLGISSDSIMRAEEGVLYVLYALMDEGHVYYPYQPLIDRAVEMLQVSSELIESALNNLLTAQRIAIEEELENEGEPNPLVYLKPFYIAETNLARRLTALKQVPAQVRSFAVEKAVTWAEEKLKIQLAARQKEAVRLAVTQKVTVITGGPGTGKTTIIKAIIKILKALKLKVLLAAPTGRAAKRMQEATGQEAKTLHRLLEYAPQKGGFQRNQNHPLVAEAIIVDEASMIDLILMHNLVKAVPPHAMLILVGDVNQLPSVGPGSVLNDLIDSGQFPVVTLTDIFRQSEKSRIVINAHRINRGEFPDLRKVGGLTDFYFIQEDDPDKVVQKIIEMCKNRIPRRFGYHPLREVQVITPMHKTSTGANALNLELQKALNPNKKGVSRASTQFNPGDKVMQVANNYEKEVYNGDIGWIKKIDFEGQEILVDFEDRLVVYDFTDLDELVLAYAVSVHKAQGSEYPVVVMPLLTQHYILLQRNLLYTGITRGKHLVVLIGTKKALAIAIRNNKTQKRYSQLNKRLRRNLNDEVKTNKEI